MRLFSIFKKKKQTIELEIEEQKWNKMWDLWTEMEVKSPYAELMTYVSEVNNGGHAQYFDNVSNNSDLKKEMKQLDSILPLELKESLKKAYKAHLTLEKLEDENSEKWNKCEAILEDCDNLFYEKEESINQILKEYASRIEL